MKLCRIEGSVHATVSTISGKGNRILIAQPINAAGRPDGPPLLALDQVSAGQGDLVLVMKEGGGARIVLNDKKSPVQCLVIAVVDDFNLAESE